LFFCPKHIHPFFALTTDLLKHKSFNEPPFQIKEKLFACHAPLSDIKVDSSNSSKNIKQKINFAVAQLLLKRHQFKLILGS
jgi:hypothetical protein